MGHPLFYVFTGYILLSKRVETGKVKERCCFDIKQTKIKKYILCLFYKTICV